MSAKSLKSVDRADRSKPEGVARAADGRTAKRHGRSVHREPGRPQGSRSPQRQFSPVMSVEADDDGVNVPEVSTSPSVNGEFGKGPSGFEAVACLERSELELGRPLFIPRGNHEDMVNQLKEDHRDRAEESDPLIVCARQRVNQVGGSPTRPVTPGRYPKVGVTAHWPGSADKEETERTQLWKRRANGAGDS